MRYLIRKLVVIIAVFFAILILIPIGSAGFVEDEESQITYISSSLNNPNGPYDIVKAWKSQIYPLDIGYVYYFATYANSEVDMLNGETYNFLRDFFKACKTPQQFFNKVNSTIIDADDCHISNLPCEEMSLSKIVSKVKERINDDEYPVLWCHQQAIFLAAGIKARFSHFDENMGAFVLDDSVDHFDIRFYRSWDFNLPFFPWKSHTQVVVKKWNGYNCSIEIDTWDEYCGSRNTDAVIWGLEENSRMETFDLTVTNPTLGVEVLDTAQPLKPSYNSASVSTTEYATITSVANQNMALLNR